MTTTSVSLMTGGFEIGKAIGLRRTAIRKRSLYRGVCIIGHAQMKPEPKHELLNFVVARSKRRVDRCEPANIVECDESRRSLTRRYEIEEIHAPRDRGLKLRTGGQKVKNTIREFQCGGGREFHLRETSHRRRP